MDPLSLTASLVTVLKLVAATSINIYDLRGKFKNAPKDVEDLLEQFQTFENLLRELEMQLRAPQNNSPPQDTLNQLWANSIRHMQKDVQSLQTVLSKMEPLLKKNSKRSEMMLLARQVLSEREVEDHQRKIQTHCSTLSNIQAMVCGQVLYIYKICSPNTDFVSEKAESSIRSPKNSLNLATKIRLNFKPFLPECLNLQIN